MIDLAHMKRKKKKKANYQSKYACDMLKMNFRDSKDHIRGNYQKTAKFEI